LLRKSGLDELPTLLNVLWGDMSLFGPKPLMPIEARHIAEDFPNRSRFRPGMISSADVMRYRIDTQEFPPVVRRLILPHDVWLGSEYAYLERMGLWSNAKLLVRFAPILVARWIFRVEDEVRTTPLDDVTILSFGLENQQPASLPALQAAGARIIASPDPHAATEVLGDRSLNCALVVLRSESPRTTPDEALVMEQAKKWGLPVVLFIEGVPPGTPMEREGVFGTARTEARLLELAIAATREGAA
jgi:hypothetical protein